MIQSGSPLIRGLGLWQAVATNMVTMIGSAIFVTIPMVLSAMGGPQALLGWLLGMLVALADGLVCAELGAAMPSAGGAYVYLEEAFGRTGWGRLLSFLFLWGIMLTAPMVLAFTAVSFSQYAHYFWADMTLWQGKFLAISVCLLATVLLCRNIISVGRLSLVLWTLVMVTAIWIVTTGLWHFDRRLAFDFPSGAFHLSRPFFAGLGAATIIAVLDYGGYQTICFIAGEVRRPVYTVPRSIVYSVIGVAIFYMLTSISVVAVLPWREAAKSSTVVSDFIERIHGRRAGELVSGLILWATFGCVFTSLLGFSRVLYAGALDGQFFSFFARVHPSKHFPQASVLFLGFLSAGLCVLDLESLIKNISAISTLTFALPQVVGLMVIRRYRRHIDLPFRMWLYPLPVVAALAGWSFVLFSNDSGVLLICLATTLAGIVVYLWRARISSKWPFHARATMVARCSK